MDRGRGFTSAEGGQRLQHPPPEGGLRVLDAGAQAEHALKLGLLQQQLAVRRQLVGAAQQRGHAVDELRHQAGVGVVRLAVVVGHHLDKGGGGGGGRIGGEV